MRAITGEILDVALDLRRSSPTFGKWESFKLSGENKHILWIPRGFAHGFRVVSQTAHVLYKATDFYAPEHERTVAWNDPALNIDWQLDDWQLDGEPVAAIVSAKDQRGVPSSRLKNSSSAPSIQPELHRNRSFNLNRRAAG